MATTSGSVVAPAAPRGFTIDRGLPAARHPILGVFPGLEGLPTAERLQPNAPRRAALFASTVIELVNDDIWMYVAPREVPRLRRRRWKPVISPEEDCIVVGLGHLRESPEFTLFMDIFHELRHVLQREAGAQLFGGVKSYVRRPTEVDAYRFVVDEARRLGASDAFLRDYLRVEWINDREFRELLGAVGVPPA